MWNLWIQPVINGINMDKWDNPRHFSHFSHPDIAQETMSLAERRSNLGFCPPEPPKSTTAMGWRDFWVNQQMIPDLLLKKSNQHFFLLEILPQMIKICNKVKQPNGNLGASAICWTASKLAGPVWQACKKWHGTGSVKQYVNMIWFELCWSWIHLGYYFIYNFSSAYTVIEWT